MGIIPKSGYEFNKEYEQFDAVKHFEFEYKEYNESSKCKCGEVLKGKITPLQCPLFKKICT